LIKDKQQKAKEEKAQSVQKTKDNKAQQLQKAKEEKESQKPTKKFSRIKAINSEMGTPQLSSENKQKLQNERQKLFTSFSESNIKSLERRTKLSSAYRKSKHAVKGTLGAIGTGALGASALAGVGVSQALRPLKLLGKTIGNSRKIFSDPLIKGTVAVGKKTREQYRRIGEIRRETRKNETLLTEIKNKQTGLTKANTPLLNTGSYSETL
jgi:hypothetical protein